MNIIWWISLLPFIDYYFHLIKHPKLSFNFVLYLNILLILQTIALKEEKETHW